MEAVLAGIDPDVAASSVRSMRGHIAAELVAVAASLPPAVGAAAVPPAEALRAE